MIRQETFPNLLTLNVYFGGIIMKLIGKLKKQVEETDFWQFNLLATSKQDNRL